MDRNPIIYEHIAGMRLDLQVDFFEKNKSDWTKNMADIRISRFLSRISIFSQFTADIRYNFIIFG